MLKPCSVRNLEDGAPASPPRGQRRVALRWGGLFLVSVALFYLLFRKLDLSEFLGALRTADWRLIALSAALSLGLCNGAAIARLWILLRELPHTRGALTFYELTSLHFASSAAHNLLPAPAGEVMRTVQLYRLHGYTVGVLVAAQLVEKILEALGLGLETLACAAFAVVPKVLGYSLYAFALLGTAGAGLILFIAWRWELAHPIGTEVPSEILPSRAELGRLGWLRVVLGGFICKLGEGLRLLRRGRVLGWAFFFSTVADLVNALTVGLCLYAVGISLPVPSWFLLMLVARAAGLLPTTPGQFGVLEAGLVLALSALGVDRGRALAFSLLYHTAHFAPVTLAGLFEMRRQLK